MVISQLIFISMFKPLPETGLFSSLLLTHSFLAFSLQLAGIGSAVLLFLLATPLFVAFALNPVFQTAFAPSPVPARQRPLDPKTAEAERTARKQKINEYAKVPTSERLAEVEQDAGHVSLWTYAIGQLTPLFMGAFISVPLLEVFVPLVC